MHAAEVLVGEGGAAAEAFVSGAVVVQSFVNGSSLGEVPDRRSIVAALPNAIGLVPEPAGVVGLGLFFVWVGSTEARVDLEGAIRVGCVLANRGHVRHIGVR